MSQRARIHFVSQDARVIRPDEFLALLHESGGVRKLAARIGSSPSTISRAARNYGIEVRCLD